MELKKPAQYMLCQNDNCKNASNCLHYICWKHFSADQPHIWVLNPLLYPSSDEECPDFKSAEKKYVWHRELETCLPIFPMQRHY